MNKKRIFLAIQRALISFTALSLSMYFFYVRDFVGTNFANFFRSILKFFGIGDQSITYSFHGPTFSFILIAFLAFLLFTYFFSKEESEKVKKIEIEEQKQTEILHEIRRAVINLPSNRILDKYPETYIDFRDNLARLRPSIDVEETILLNTLQTSLQQIDTLARSFVSDKESTIKSCVNFMVYLPVDELSPERKAHCAKLRIHYKKKWWESRIDGYLLFENRMSFYSHQIQKGERGPNDGEISIPLFKSNSRYKNVIPGAPLAFINNDKEMTYYANLGEIISDMKDRLSGKLYREASGYFKTKKGSRIESLFSVRIGPSDKPLGVLNVHANIENYLGGKQYTTSFFALLTPLLDRLERYLQLYRKILLSSKNKI